MRWKASGSGQPGVHHAGLQRVRRAHTKEPQCAHPRLHELRTGTRPRCERGQNYSMARTAPSGSPGVGWGNEPRTRRPLGRAECQATGNGGDGGYSPRDGRPRAKSAGGGRGDPDAAWTHRGAQSRSPPGVGVASAPPFVYQMRWFDAHWPRALSCYKPGCENVPFSLCTGQRHCGVRERHM